MAAEVKLIDGVYDDAYEAAVAFQREQGGVFIRPFDDADVTKVFHNPGGENTDIIGCFLHISMEAKDRDHFEQIKRAIQNAGYVIKED